MIVYKLPEMTVTVLPDRPLAVALGNFDGVHLGHARLLSAARDIAREIPNCASVAWTFTALAKGGSTENIVIPALTTPTEKARAIAAAGIEYVVFEEFETVRALSPASFVAEYLTKQFRCAAAVCGFNFRFGAGAVGDAAMLSRLLGARGIPVTVVEPVLAEGKVLSSTRIRAAVAAGEMEEARALLGRPFSICFPVVHGHRLGRTIGIPTLNQNFPDGHIVPRHGIYACLCTVGERCYPAVANVGTRPTVSDSGAVNCETHIIGYDGSLYGESVRVSFCRRLRGEIKFDSVSGLKAQIETDIATACAYFAEFSAFAANRADTIEEKEDG